MEGMQYPEAGRGRTPMASTSVEDLCSAAHCRVRICSVSLPMCWSFWSIILSGSQNITLNVTLGASEGASPNVHWLTTTSLVIHYVTFVTGTIGNGLVIYVTGYRMTKTVNSVWFLNLACTDFLLTAFRIISIIHTTRNFEWIFGPFMCKLNSMVNVHNMFTSIFILVAISVDRCLCICVVVWAQNKRTTRKAEFTCVGIWLVSLICSIPYTLHRETIVLNDKTYCCLNITLKGHKDLIVLRFVLGFLIPFVIIIGSYVAIGMRTRRLHRKRIGPRSLRIIFAIILAFFICWLPFHVFQFIDYYCHVVAVNHTFKSFVYGGVALSSSMAIFNSCLNPFLYVFMCDDFQRKLHQSVCLVFESTFAEDLVISSRSLTSHLSRTSRKSDSTAPEPTQRDCD
ncbi:N-formyl peptide receptor 3-like [Hypomesus transpacificus]|uniref:N-formyl peptide receptor 3-like n=1 Tax=Hypomesus transpacificus TaxID=137520 RepID=UPI001F0732A0|nr:N-formyl peptide receptor 3-like [Hypomesus transpacificus]